METGKIKAFVITRRDFIKMTMAGAAALGLSPLFKWPKMAEAAGKPAVVWLEGQDCAGCTESVITYENIGNVILNDVAIRYHETIMAGAGDVAIGALDAAIAEGGYVLVVEGSIPLAESGDYCVVAGETFKETVKRAAQSAAAILPIGACATYGGIPKAGPTDAQGVDDFLQSQGINKPLINLPGCPVHPTWFINTVVSYLTGQPIPVDEFKRPVKHFASTIHSMCPRRWFYKKGKYLRDWNDPKQRRWCLLLKGCKGPEAYADCGTILWNQGANWCVGNNAPCSGCTEPDFYNKFTPLYVGEPADNMGGM